MAFSLTSLDLWYAAREWQETLLDGRIDKVYQGSDLVSIRIFKTGLGNTYLHYRMPGLLYTAEDKPYGSAQLPHFAAYLRKRLSNARVRGIRQVSRRDRVLEIGLEKDEGFILIIELLPPGNLILCDKDYKILMPLQGKRFSDRIIRAQAVYEMKARPELDEEGFAAALASSQKNLVKTLAIDMGLSGVYAEELCARAGIDKGISSKDADAKALYAGYLSLFEQPIAAHSDGQRPYPFALTTKPEAGPSGGSFNAAIAAAADIVPEAAARQDKALAKQEAIIAQQEQALSDLSRMIGEEQRKGELLYEHYLEVQGLFAWYGERRKEGTLHGSASEMKEAFPFVVSFDESKMQAVIELPDP